jgi:signal transduction histidine kinase
MAGDLLARSNLPDGSNARPLIDAAREDVARLEDVAHRLLELSRSRATTIGLDREKIPMRLLVERGAGIFELQAREAGVSIETNLVEVPPISGDATKLGWALSNLIGNALRYTPRGGVIRIALAASADGVRLSVRDDGPGIPGPLCERIFERFAQGEEPRGSAGLGLAIVRDVVQAHGGRIFLESEVGCGSCFTIELPLH